MPGATTGDDLLMRLLRGEAARVRTRLNEACAWEALASHAAREGLAGLALEALAGAGVGAPDGAAQVLRAAALRTEVDNRRLARQVERVAAAFADAGVPLMLLKGAALQRLAYARPDLRPMSDIDLLVREQDARRAGEVLARLGYARTQFFRDPDYYPRFYYETHYECGDESLCMIDLHVRPWRPMRYARTVPADALWSRAKTISLDGVPVFVPCDDHLLIHLAVHAAVHGGARLLWLYDIARVIRQRAARIDWHRLADTAVRWRVALPTQRALESVERTIGASAPTHALAALRCATTGWRDRLALWHAPRDAAHPLRHVLANLLTTPGTKYRLAYVASLLWPRAGRPDPITTAALPGATGTAAMPCAT